ncbi:hypothetical protein HPP92_023966 [Vanilla planifolia]|uniref:Phosphatidic acid phosphatase type 2/haloperoxidase domain-containing protein n=1 Tax=Vanilla planifolia TaxID=51239 RepID=A0A835PNW2_VANPL|nr:hypothetical protein HPP92_024320 [Vanilla planifolia]KAG0456178.1 hypothetical protein HPP92_023966 [Vanilla planifolia]
MYHEIKCDPLRDYEHGAAPRRAGDLAEGGFLIPFGFNGEPNAAKSFVELSKEKTTFVILVLPRPCSSFPHSWLDGRRACLSFVVRTLSKTLCTLVLELFWRGLFVHCHLIAAVFAEEGVFSYADDDENPLLSPAARNRVTMVDIQLGCHTIRSHGTTVARFHMHDWIMLILLVVIDAILNVIEPFHRFVGKDMMTDLRYPLKSNTVPFWAVPLIGIILPIFIFTCIYFKKQNVYDLHNAILGLLFSVLVTGVLTDAIKDAVGRPRPDFFWRCFPDGIDAYDKVTTSVICHGDKSVIKEGHKSFPSGHSSWSFAGLGFLAWYLAGKIRVFDRSGHVAKLCIVLLPLLCAALVAISRVDDYWHHWQDVFAGGFLGLFVASFCYLQFFPPPYDSDGWGPHAYFRALEESRSVSAPASALDLTSEEHNRLVSRGSNATLAAMEAGVRNRAGL